MTTERALRAAALLIALLAFIDPALSRAGLDRPSVVVLHASASEGELAAQVAATLGTTFDVRRTDVPAAAAYVLAGADLPQDWRPPASAAVFAVTPDAGVPTVQVLQVVAPDVISIDSIAPIRVDLRVDGTGNRDVLVTLIVDGVRLQQVTRRVTGEETRVSVPLTLVPSQPGVKRVRVEASAQGRATTVADFAIDVTARVWRVLSFDARPTYASTFVRRALEADARFSVTTRVVTSRASAIRTTAAPSSLNDTGALDEFDLVVVGASDALGAVEAASLERYLRERHGAVVLLPEGHDREVLARLTGEAVWQEDRRLDPVPVSSGASGNTDAWSATEFLWPSRWPPLVVPLATLAPTKEAEGRLPVWQMPVGSGRLVVSSAIDGWRSRAGGETGFSAFWRGTAAALAHATPPLVDVLMRNRLLTAGQPAEVTVQLFAGDTPVARVIDEAGGEWPVRLWRDASSSGAGGEWTGAFRAPDVPGRYRLDVTTGGMATGAAEFLVVDDAPVPPRLAHDGLAALAASAHRGAVVSAGQLAALPARISEAAAPTPIREVWHPMRSLWWLFPFTLCAAGEWWLRRHRGER